MNAAEKTERYFAEQMEAMHAAPLSRTDKLIGSIVCYGIIAVVAVPACWLLLFPAAYWLLF